MTSKKLGIALMVWLVGVGFLGGGFYFSKMKRTDGEPVVGTLIKGEPVLSEIPDILSLEELGEPSMGTTHIEQRVIGEIENPYSMTDPQSVSNFMASAEGRFLEMIFARLNSPTDTKITEGLSNLTEAELSNAIKISSDFQGILHGYRPSDNPSQFLYDDNLMHQFRPHADLLRYVQAARPDRVYQAQLRGSILPKISNGATKRLTITIGKREVMYLVRQSVGTCLIESIGPETKYFKVAFQFNVGIPHGIDTEGCPLLLWPDDLRITIDPIDKVTWEANQGIYYVKG